MPWVRAEVSLVKRKFVYLSAKTFGVMGSEKSNYVNHNTITHSISSIVSS